MNGTKKTMTAFSYNLRQAREAKGLSQHELAQMLNKALDIGEGVDGSYNYVNISTWENGRCKPRSANVIRTLAHLFGYETNEFYNLPLGPKSDNVHEPISVDKLRFHSGKPVWLVLNDEHNQGSYGLISSDGLKIILATGKAIDPNAPNLQIYKELNPMLSISKIAGSNPLSRDDAEHITSVYISVAGSCKKQNDYNGWYMYDGLTEKFISEKDPSKQLPSSSYGIEFIAFKDAIPGDQ